MAKFCAYCGKPMGDGDVFCANCGRQAAPPQAPQQPVQPPVQQPQQPPQQWQAPPQQPRQGAWTAAPAAPQQPPQGQWPQQPQQPPQGQWPQQPQQPRQQWQPQHQAPRAGRGGKGLLIGVIAVVAVAALLLIGGFVWPGFFKKADGGAGKPAAAETPAPTAAPAATEAPKATAPPEATAEPRETPASKPEPTASAYANPFTDISTADWYYDAVMWAGERGIVSGTEFKPGDLTNRGQALTFLWRSAGKPATTLTASPYSDVSESDYFYTPVLWGYENGVISNSGDGMFHADGALTRAQAITFLCRAAGGADTVGKRSFSDVREDNWYFASANWALANGVVGRDSSWAFKPDQQMTRAMFVTFLYRTFAEDAKKADGAEPAAEGLRDVGIGINVDDHGVQSFRTVTKNGNRADFTASVSDYRVFEADDAMPRREGFEWRVMTLRTSTKDLDGSGLRLSLLVTDAYNVRLHHASKLQDSSGMYVYTVLYNGSLTDYTIWWTKTDDDNKGTSTWTFTASVPVGYDGVVVGVKNADVVSSSLSIADYYTGEADFALFRMK